MGEQYFAKRPASKRRPTQFEITLRGHPFTFQTDAGVFSRKEIDRGTELLLEAVQLGPCEAILDLGCGYGAIGNAEVRVGDLYTPVEDLAFDHILCNPPIRAGRGVVDRIVADAPGHLLDGGSLWLRAPPPPGGGSRRSPMVEAVKNRGGGTPGGGGCG